MFRYLRKKLSAAGLIPESLVGWTAVYSGILWVLLYAWDWLRGTPQGSGAFDVSFNFTTLVFVGALFILTYRWLKQKFMWRLRNRLIVTYIFIGVIPLVLVATMALLAGYLFAGQFSSYVVTNDVKAEVTRVASLNDAIATQVLARVRERQEPSAKNVAIDQVYPERRVIAYYGGKSYLLAGDTQGPIPTQPTTEALAAIVLDGDTLHLRASKKVSNDLVVLSDVPLTNTRLAAMVSDIGEIAVYGSGTGTVTATQPGAKDYRGSRVKIGNAELDSRPKASAGKTPPPKGRFDVSFPPMAAIVDAIDAQSGKATSILITVRTRPSMLYQRLFLTLGDMTNVIVIVLIGVGVVFAVIELVALIIGVRLTRTMTKSVAALYDATQHVNEGNFSHRIRVTSRDQLAALETSFNSMTESLEKLIAEQKEKQRIESELAIAQEVQALLFPRDITELESFEVHGVCRPARTVSGDYYDFLPVGPTRLGIALGDIAGKGISAALLMATVHAFVRAYTLMEYAPVAAGMAAQSARESAAILASRNGWLPPGTLLAMLNQQLYRSTPTEKYATMFLGFYDQTQREFTYSNAGHLPPLIVGADGSIRELETGGTVVGLFGDMTYPDGSVKMNPGDIFVAYSDGVTEPENEFGEFGADRLAMLIQENRHQSLARISDVVIGAVTDWIGSNEQPDDVTLVLARVR